MTTAEARESVGSVLAGEGMTALEAEVPDFWFAVAVEEAHAEGSYDFSDAVALETMHPRGRPGRRLRIEIVGAGGGCVAVKVWEACPPEMAPPGADAAWHPCGGALSRPLRAAIAILKEKLTPPATGDAVRREVDYVCS